MSAYDEKTDAIVYGNPVTATFTRADWIALAVAALDQAGAPVAVQRGVQSLVFADSASESTDGDDWMGLDALRDVAG